MRVLIVGAGVIGVTTAYYLARDGHRVTVVERRSAAAEETSLANGGQISASHTDPWPSSDNLRKVIGWLGRADAPLLFRLHADPALFSWCARFLANCTRQKARLNTERMLRLAMYSRDAFVELRKEHDFDFDHLAKGILHVFRDPEAFERAKRQSAYVTELGCERKPIDAAACVDIEPALAEVRGRLVGGVFCPDDESGDAHAFTVQLADLCRDLGVSFEFDVSVADLALDRDRVVGVETTAGTFRADSYVVAAGSYAPLLTRPIGITLPVYPAKGYSATLSVTHPERAPVTSIIDDERKLVFSRLGDKLRIAGLAEIAGYDTRIDEARARIVLEGALDLFPGCGDGSEAEYWAGLRPQTPDSVPVVGRTRYENLFLNTGHGTLGWTMACGSGRLLADLMAGRPPGIDIEGLEVNRF